MKTMFRSRKLRNLVEKGFGEKEDNNYLNESVNRDAKALYLIQQALDDRILLKITKASITKEAWDILKT